MPSTDWKNKLYFGDNLDILREEIPAETVDLIYLDPPFNSKASYNVIFGEPNGSLSSAQIMAFDDTWHWGEESEEKYSDLVTMGPRKVSLVIEAMRNFLGENDMMAYLVMMAARLIELHRVLKPTGSIYLHCDPTASHYLKMLLDAVFGLSGFQNEIVWKRSSAHNDPRRYGNIHDVLFFFTKTRSYTWNPQYTQYKQAYLDSEWKVLPSGRRVKYENMLDPQNRMQEYDFMGTSARWRTDYSGMMRLWNLPQTEVPNSHGRIKLGRNGKPIKRCRIVFLDEKKGVTLQTWWDDILYLAGGSHERLGYPTQKPEALLERIIMTSSNDGDIVLDPFCGCGTTVVAAEGLNRRWIGIDITHLAITLMKKRLQDSFGEELSPYDVIGDPKDLAGARALAAQDKYQFEWWALGLVDALPSQDKKKGADEGIDGYLRFPGPDKGRFETIICQVKGGDNISVKDIRDLRGTMEGEKAVIGVFVTLHNPTRNMLTEAVKAGFYEHSVLGTTNRYPRIQILTIEDILNGKSIQYPRQSHSQHRRAKRRTKGPEPKQQSLMDG